MNNIDTVPEIDWNLITKNFEANDSVRNTLWKKIRRLEKHLERCSPKTVQLQVVLERHPVEPRHTAELTLRLCDDILQSKGAAPDVVRAFDEALTALQRKLKSVRSRPHREKMRTQPHEQKQAEEASALQFATQPLPAGAGPQNLGDVVREFLQQHYADLIDYVRRQIHHDTLTGDISENAIDATDIVDEAVRQAQSQVTQKPKRLDWRSWVFQLLHQELRRQTEFLKRKQVEEVPLEKQEILPEPSSTTLQSLERVVEEMEPETIRVEDLVPASEIRPPDQIVEERDRFEQLLAIIRRLPQAERDIFELHWMEGFGPKEIARISGQPLDKVQQTITAIEQQVPRDILEEVSA